MASKTFTFRSLIIFSLFLFYVVSSETINSGLVNKNVDTTIDIASQLAKISSKINLENTGKSSVRSFLIAIDPKIKNTLSYISAQSGNTKLRISEVKVDGHADKTFWRVDLRDDLPAGKTVSVEVDYVLGHELKPHPVQISQREKQLVLYEGNAYFFSPYNTLKQKKVFTITTPTVESFSQVSPVSHSDNTITYGPYENIAPFSSEKVAIHYENNSPFLVISRLQREIELSHWGNIAVEETIDIVHDGAKLKGSFSRYEYQRESQSGVNSVKFFKTALPASASDVYYRDEIGNISTSHMRVLSDSVELDLRPRFPLFGGWKTHYVLGYNVPSYEYLFNSGDQFVLKMRLLDHVFDDMLVDELVTRIILPEGSNSIELATPYTVRRLPDSLHYTYLDTKGRPVISITKRNLVENHIDDFELKYTYPRILMLHEPLLVVVAFYLLFLLVIVYVRLDFSITKDEAEENRMRTAGYCEKVLAHQDKRVSIYQQLDDLLSKLKTNKDVNSFLTSVKALNQDYKAVTANISDLLVKLKQEAVDIADKVSELQKHDKHLKEIYGTQQSLYVDKLVPGKIHRNTFLENENEINKKKEEYTDKINSIIKSMQ
jgi:oligosaccharyltransferase complex subunit alpha (ribophorin I)